MAIQNDSLSAEQEKNIAFDASTLSGPPQRVKKDLPDGLWLKCPACESTLYRKNVTENQEVCPECQYHFRMTGRQRIAQLADEDSFEEFFTDIKPADPLKFEWSGKQYAERLAAEQKKTGLDDSILTGVSFIKGRRVALGVMAGDFLMGSMGSVLGEKLSLLIEFATKENLPLVVVCISGGARMHEGALSLMQMAKTSAALARYDQAGGLYISVLTDPTTGGTTASFAMLGDVIIAEPKALIGFAGPRVIANTIKAELPENFQTAEFLLEKGFVDMIVHRHQLRSEIARIIDYCKPS
ncbi:MAG TPA: acetyl-CoA carboxylase, carboxyltransferase subunit beta [Phycisphaerae bacterium]|nr:acetyl-CoA carboxylase, carboxyltransferase subunit beta [Phycisphaerae bacterium]HPS51928.1 acetyl-CoA carboxylase, carboxyltransferase subunit beta [Phycisphaerae bacterium]